MDFNTILIIFGVIALVALVVHGLWANRREKSKYFQNAGTFNRTSQSSAQYDDADPLATQAPSPFASAQQTAAQQPLTSQTSKPANYEQVNYEMRPSPYATPSQQADLSSTADYRYSEKSVDDIKISIPNVTPTQPIQPVYQMRQEPVQSVQPQVTAHQDLAHMSISELEAQGGFDGINASSDELRETLANMVTEEPVEHIQRQPSVQFNESQAPAVEQKPKQTTGFIMLYIVSPERHEFQGHQLAQTLENYGFIWGEDLMYHRHLDLSVASPVLFTVANIEQPGTFDVYNMTEFSTMGLTIFMKLPTVGNNLANLRTMLATAKQLAKDLGGFVLTDQQEIFDDLAEREYLSRVA